MVERVGRDPRPGRKPLPTNIDDESFLVDNENETSLPIRARSIFGRNQSEGSWKGGPEVQVCKKP